MHRQSILLHVSSTLQQINAHLGAQANTGITPSPSFLQALDEAADLWASGEIADVDAAASVLDNFSIALPTKVRFGICALFDLDKLSRPGKDIVLQELQ